MIIECVEVLLLMICDICVGVVVVDFCVVIIFGVVFFSWVFIVISCCNIVFCCLICLFNGC